MFVVVTHVRTARLVNQSFVESAAASLRRYGDVEVVWIPTRSVANVIDRLDNRTLVIAGGDGTLHHVLQDAADSDLLEAVEFGLIPGGAGNDFARSAGIPLDLQGSVKVIGQCESRRFDLIIDEAGALTVNVTHMGLSANGSNIAQRLKPYFGRLAYPLGSVFAGLRDHRFTATLSMHSTVLDETTEALMIAVCNGKYFGGGLPVSITAEPDDGLLSVVVIPAAGIRRRALTMLKLAQGQAHSLPDLQTISAAQIRIDLLQVERSVSDGESLGPVKSKVFTCESQCWRLRAP